MDFQSAKAQVVAILQGVSISDPASMSLRRVYESPPEVLQELPCAVLYPAAVRRDRGPGGYRATVWTLRWHVVAQDARTATASEILESFAEAIVDAFDSNTTLNGTASRIDGPLVDVGSALVWGGQTLPAQRYELVIHQHDAATFGP